MFFKGFTPHADVHLWKTFTLLEVYIPSKDAVLVLKLMGYREKDRDDVLALCQQLDVATRSQAQDLVNGYVAERWQKEYRLDLTLDALFT